MINYSHIGFLALKIIGFLILLLGYFMNSQQLNKAQQDKGSPLIENKKDYFYSEFKRVILIVDEQFTGFEINEVYYHIDSQFTINYDVLYNTVIHGISPIAQLQYWNIQYTTLDSLTYQIQKHNKTSYVSSYKPYIDYDQFSNHLYLRDGRELVDKIKEDDFAFLYVDNLQLSSIEYDELLQEIDANAMLMILRFDKVYFVTKRERLSTDIHTRTFYSIDSLTSTISCLLDLPIPLENHGVMLPGLLYKTKDTNDTNLMQINDYMMNLYQLFEHYSIIEKKKSQVYKSDLKAFSEQFQLVMENSQLTSVEAFLIQIQSELRQLSAVINSEISGNILVMMLSLLLGIYTLYQVFFKVQDITDLDWQVMGVAVVIAFIEMKFLKIILFIILLARMRQPMIQSILGLLLIISSFPFYQITWIGSIIYLGYKNQNLIKPVLLGLERESLGQFVILLLLGLISQYFSYMYILLVPYIIFVFKKTELIIVVICLICRLQNVLPIILLSTQYFKENEQSVFRFPAYLIIDILYITITCPVFPSNPGITQLESYWHILDIVGLIYCQQMFYHMQVRLNQSLEISGKTIIAQLKGLGDCNIELFDSIILITIVEIVWVGELIISEIMSSDMKTLGSQYFTLQFMSTNLIILGFYLVRESFKITQELLPQNEDDFQNTEMKEIEI